MDNISDDEKLARFFSGELSEKNIEEMEKDFLNNNREKEIKDYSRIWEKSKKLGLYDNIDVEGDWRLVRAKMGFKQRAKKIPFTKYIIRVAAIFSLALALAYMLNNLVKNIPKENHADYISMSSADDIRNIYLPDSTKVTLNRNSQLIYNNEYGILNRQVILEGEAFFEVKRNEKLPFKVFSNNSTIEVLGTSFNVKSTDKTIIVGVVSGHVTIYETTKKENRCDLIKDEQTSYNFEDNIFVEKTKLNTNTFAWKTGVIEIEGEHLDDLFKIIADYYNLNLKLQVSHPFTETLNSNSLIEINDIDAVLNIIHKTAKQDFSYFITEKELIIRD